MLSLGSKADALIPALSLRLNPVSLLHGGLNTTFDFDLSRHWSVGPSLAYFQSRVDSRGAFLTDFNVKSRALGGRATWHSRGILNNGFYLATTVQHTFARVVTKDLFGPLSGQASTVLLGAYAGHTWLWKDWSLMLGLGYRRPLTPSEIHVTSSLDAQVGRASQSSGIHAELFMGWRI